MEPPLDEPKQGAPDWMVTFADLMSLLLTFFVLLLSFSNMEDEKFIAVSGSVRSAFGTRSPVDLSDVPTGHGLMPNTIPPKNEPEDTTDNEPIIVRLREGIEQAGLAEGAVIKATEDGIMLQLDGDLAFEAGGTELGAEAANLLQKLVNISLSAPGQLEVRGHTDDRPITNSVYPSNWELSAARAGSVVRFLIERGVPPHRLKAVGLGDSRPLVPNDSDANRARNRRVEFVFITMPAKMTNPVTAGGAFRSRNIGEPINPG